MTRIFERTALWVVAVLICAPISALAIGMDSPHIDFKPDGHFELRTTVNGSPTDLARVEVSFGTEMDYSAAGLSRPTDIDRLMVIYNPQTGGVDIGDKTALSVERFDLILIARSGPERVDTIYHVSRNVDAASVDSTPPGPPLQIGDAQDQTPPNGRRPQDPAPLLHGDFYGPVPDIASLSGIAAEIAARDGFDPLHTELAIYTLNPGAFVGGKPGAVKAGSMLRVPKAEDIARATQQKSAPKPTSTTILKSNADQGAGGLSSGAASTQLPLNARWGAGWQYLRSDIIISTAVFCVIFAAFVVFTIKIARAVKTIEQVLRALFSEIVSPRNRHPPHYKPQMLSSQDVAAPSSPSSIASKAADLQPNALKADPDRNLPLELRRRIGRLRHILSLNNGDKATRIELANIYFELGDGGSFVDMVWPLKETLSRQEWEPLRQKGRILRPYDDLFLGNLEVDMTLPLIPLLEAHS